MLRKLLHILALGLKELNSIRADPILLALTVYTFSYAVYAVATGAKTEVDHVPPPSSTRTVRNCPG